MQYQCFAPRPWLSVEALRQTLEPQGVVVTREALLVKLDFPGGDTVTFAEGAGIIPRDERVAPGHIDTYRMLHEIVHRSGLPVTFKGWKELSVHVGEVTFALNLIPDELNVPMEGLPGFLIDWELAIERLDAHFYREVAHEIVHAHLIDRLEIPDPRAEFGTFGLFKRSTTFDVAAEPGDVYAFVALLDAEALGLHRARDPIHVAIAMDLAPANDEGTVTFNIPQTDLTWLDAWPENPTPGTAMLIRLTAPGQVGVYGHEIAPPASFVCALIMNPLDRLEDKGACLA